jgi:hypothetical protein
VKYVIQWTNRDSLNTVQENKALLEAFGRWTPANTNIQQFLSALDGRGGLLIAETDDPMNVLRDVTKFGLWLDFTVTPMVEIMEAVPVFSEAIEFVEGG